MDTENQNTQSKTATQALSDPSGSHDCAAGLHRKAIISPNRLKQIWERKCDACGAVVDWWSFGTPPVPLNANAKGQARSEARTKLS